MTKLAIIAAVAVASSAFAGQEIAAPVQNRSVIPQEACFGETELQVDLFGVYLDNHGVIEDGFGGGFGLTYYFHRNFGFSLDASASESEADTVYQFSAGFVGRYPFEVGGVCLAPYAKVSGGVQSENGSEAFVAFGGGIEWRATPRLGIFAEANYGFLEGAGDDFFSLRSGVRLVF